MTNSLKSIGTECSSLEQTSKNSSKHLTPPTITRSIALTGFLAFAVLAANPAGAVSLVNGDFETGDLTGWTVFTTANGNNGTGLPSVTSFDTTGSGTSNSAQFRVGQVSFLANAPAGGGITQNITLSSGILNLSVDVAANNPTGNASGGIFSLLLDGAVLNTFNSGGNSGTFRNTLTASTNVSAGNYTIGIQMTRPFLNTSATPSQYVDNFVISGSSTSATAVPEPFTVIGSIIGGTAAFRMRKKLKSSTKV